MNMNIIYSYIYLCISVLVIAVLPWVLLYIHICHLGTENQWNF